MAESKSSPWTGAGKQETVVKSIGNSIVLDMPEPWQKLLPMFVVMMKKFMNDLILKWVVMVVTDF